jgi:hypothetical protein
VINDEITLLGENMGGDEWQDREPWDDISSTTQINK